jgi:hypothetical protein
VLLVLRHCVSAAGGYGQLMALDRTRLTLVRAGAEEAFGQSGRRFASFKAVPLQYESPYPASHNRGLFGCLVVREEAGRRMLQLHQRRCLPELPPATEVQQS